MPRIGGPFTLTDHHGQPFSYPADLKGAYALIYFGFTHCPDICPEELEKISQALDMVNKALPGRLQPLFISCDPERDSPAAITEYLQDFHPTIIGITGPLDRVKEAARLFRVYFKAAKTGSSESGDYLVDHTIFYYLMSPDGEYVAHFGRDHQPKEVADTILQIMRSQDGDKQQK